MADLKKYMYKRAAMSLGKNGGEDPPKKGTAPLPGGIKAPSKDGIKVPTPSSSSAPSTSSMGPENYVSVADRIKNTSERYKKQPNYNVKDAAKRNPGNIEAIEKDLKNTRSRMGAMYQEGKITRSQLKDSIRSTYDLGTPKSKIKSEVKSVGGRTKAGQVLRNMGVGKNKAKSGGLTMKAETRSRSCGKPGLDSK